MKKCEYGCVVERLEVVILKTAMTFMNQNDQLICKILQIILVRHVIKPVMSRIRKIGNYQMFHLTF